MTMYLVLSALTSSPISLVAATKASAFSFKVVVKNIKPVKQVESLFTVM
jgi:hypothetical protein